jgi:hypothetical protein
MQSLTRGSFTHAVSHQGEFYAERQHFEHRLSRFAKILANGKYDKIKDAH